MELERLYTSSSLAHEIAVLLADAVIYQSKWLRTVSGDIHGPDATARRSERRRLMDSKDWFDRLIVERMACDAEQQKAP